MTKLTNAPTPISKTASKPDESPKPATSTPEGGPHYNTIDEWAEGLGYLYHRMDTDEEFRKRIERRIH